MKTSWTVLISILILVSCGFGVITKGDAKQTNEETIVCKSWTPVSHSINVYELLVKYNLECEKVENKEHRFSLFLKRDFDLKMEGNELKAVRKDKIPFSKAIASLEKIPRKQKMN